MSLAEELKKPVNQRTRICTIAIIKSQLSKTDHEALQTAIQDVSIPSSFIARALVNEGYKVKVLVYFTIFPHACAFYNLGFGNQFDDVVPMLKSFWHTAWTS